MNCRSKKVLLLGVLLSITTMLFSFDKGWVFGLRADFGGALTIPSISDETLKYMNPLAEDMTGFLSGLLIGGEASVGYIFDSSDLFGLPENHSFSGVGLHSYVGVGMGNVSQRIAAVQNDMPLDIFIVVDYTPVVNFGLKSHALFFDNRFSVGLGIGGKAVLDYTPQYLVYSTDPKVIPTEIGVVIVPDDLLTKMNPLSFSGRLEIGYAIPILPTTEFLLGFYTQFNLFSPGYLTVPPTLENIAQTNRPGANDTPPSEKLDFKRPFDDYWINSLDFGVNLGIALKL